MLVKLCETFEIDDWDDFLSLLDEISEQERYFLLDLLSISAAFDGHLSRLERHHLPEAFGDLTDIYLQRIEKLTNLL